MRPTRDVNAHPGVETRRALFIVITDSPGGAERVAFSLASELASRPGWEVDVKVICSQIPDSFSKRVLSSKTRVRYGPFRRPWLSVAVLPFRLMFRRYDLVFTTHIYTNALVSLLRRTGLLRPGRLVMRESMSLFDRFGGFKARRFRWLYRAYGGEDLIIAQTGYMADHVRARLPLASAARLRVLPNPIDVGSIESAALEPLEPELSERLQRRRNIVFCGRLVDFKRPGTALEAFRMAEPPDAQLVFLGGGPLEAEVRRRASEAGLSDRVLFLGMRSNPHPVIAACQYGLVTSANEGFPNVVLEMMACGVHKIVMTPCAGDLDQLPAVTITRTFDEREIADGLRTAVASGEDCSETYRKFAATRSVGAYLDVVLHQS